MKRLLAILLASALAPLLFASPAGAAFGFKSLDLTFEKADGSPETRAGGHPFVMRTDINFNTKTDPVLGVLPEGSIKDVVVDLPPGFATDPRAVPRCSNADFLFDDETGASITACPNGAAVGFLEARTKGALTGEGAPVYNLAPPPGVAAKFAARVLGVTVVIEGGLRAEGDQNLYATVANASGVEPITGSELVLWGDPANPVHNEDRGICFLRPGTCPPGITPRAFITLPRSCTGPLTTVFKIASWENPGEWVEETTTTDDGAVPPTPQGMTDCGKLGLSPDVSVKPTSDHSESPSGLEFNLEIDDPGMTDPDSPAQQSDIKKAVVTLPEGVTVNPSVAEGLATCSRAAFKAEAVDSAPGEGCPEASKIGTVQAESPLLEGEFLEGQLFVATQDDPATAAPGVENPFDSLIALYLAVKDPELGIMVKLAGKVEPDPHTGQLVSTFDDIPQLPVSRFRLRFREGGRSPLITPGACGTYTTEAVFTPWANPDKPVVKTADFQITRGVGGGPCPPAGAPPFKPGFGAGTLNNRAASYSPVHMRLTRSDGEQDITRLSATLPPGLIGKLAGVSQCADGAIAAAKGKTGRQELAAPSCSANSKIGRVLSGAGVGSQLTYVSGNLYLGGPYNGAPLSAVAIVPAVAGPFDAGTVVVRTALTLDPRTAQVQVDGHASDPIPHILKGIVLKVRDLRVYADRPQFTLNPTSCRPLEFGATVFGGFLDVFSPADDVAVGLSDRFQAADCASLGFQPRLSMALKGGTGRGAHPAFTAVLRPRPGDANLKRTVVRLPKSAFLEQGHIRTVCTRVQFAADSCPSGSIYGRVRAFTPLLDEPLEGPAYLRSSDNLLPDLVFALHGIVDIEAAARIDSIKGGIRATFAAIPDAPVSKVVVRMAGGKRGLIVNSRNLCATVSRATVHFGAQNGRRAKLRPPVRAVGCDKKKARALRTE